jgi:PKD repeat protein
MIDIYYYMMPYMFEPYNAYQQPPRKKHWMEIAEEEALYHRMVQEALVKEAKTQQMTVADSVQDGTTATAPSQAAGAGGVPPHSFFIEQSEFASFTMTPTLGIGPLSVTFVDTTNTPGDDIVFWNFGSGSLTSTSTTPAPLTYTATGSYTINFQSTSSLGNATAAPAQTLTVNAPTIVANFTQNSSSGAHPVTVIFTDTSTYSTSALDTITWAWTFKTGGTTVSSSAVENPAIVFNAIGAFTASVVVTELAYGITSTKTSASCIVVS